MFGGNRTYEGCVGSSVDDEDADVEAVDVEVMGGCVKDGVAVVVGGGCVEEEYVGGLWMLVTKGAVTESSIARFAFCCLASFRSFFAVFSISGSIGSRVPAREDLGIKLLVMTRPRQRRQFVRSVKPNKE